MLFYYKNPSSDISQTNINIHLLAIYKTFKRLFIVLTVNSRTINLYFMFKMKECDVYYFWNLILCYMQHDEHGLDKSINSYLLWCCKTFV